MSDLDQELAAARALVRELTPRLAMRAQAAARARELTLEHHRRELLELAQLVDEGGAPHIAMRLEALIARMPGMRSAELVAVALERDELSRELERARRELVDVTRRLADALSQLEALK